MGFIFVPVPPFFVPKFIRKGVIFLKKIVFCLAFFLICFVHLDVFATSVSFDDSDIDNYSIDDEVPSFDENERVSSGHAYEEFYTDDIEYIIRYDINAVGDSVLFLLEVPDIAGVPYYCLGGIGSVNLVRHGISVDSITGDMYQPYEYGELMLLSLYPLDLTFGSNRYFSRYKFDTDIPIFDTTDPNYLDYIDAYIEEGDKTNAKNGNDFTDFVSEVEMPQNLVVTGGYASHFEPAYSIENSLDFNWSQTVDTSVYYYQIDICMEITEVSKSGGTNLIGYPYSSGWVRYSTSSYDGSNNINYSIPADELNDRLLEKCLQDYVNSNKKQISYKGYLITKLMFRVRNLVGSNASDYVVVVIDKNSVSTTAHVENDDGEKQDNDMYNDTDVAVPGKDSLDFNNVNIGLDGILSYIRGGFGLLGNNGIISLMSSCFLFLPQSFWTLLNFFVAMMVAVGVVKLIKSFIFG